MSWRSICARKEGRKRKEGQRVGRRSRGSNRGGQVGGVAWQSLSVLLFAQFSRTLYPWIKLHGERERRVKTKQKVREERMKRGRKVKE